ncbi:MAG: acyl-CoA thioesterase [Spirosomataceae bacterium]
MIQQSKQSFPLITYDKLRYADTDRQGHVNNAIFSTFFETGRVEMIYHPDLETINTNVTFVLAALHIQFLREIKWPGIIKIGTAVTKVGNSSIQLHQQLFQDDECMAIAESTIVQVDATSRPTAISEKAKEIYSRFVIED